MNKIFIFIDSLVLLVWDVLLVVLMVPIVDCPQGMSCQANFCKSLMCCDALSGLLLCHLMCLADLTAASALIWLLLSFTVPTFTPGNQCMNNM